MNDNFSFSLTFRKPALVSKHGIVGDSPKQVAAFIGSEYVRFGALIKESGCGWNESSRFGMTRQSLG